jgi:hypothetical protein
MSAVHRFDLQNEVFERFELCGTDLIIVTDAVII